jgi:hypothetical protein
MDGHDLLNDSSKMADWGSNAAAESCDALTADTCLARMLRAKRQAARALFAQATAMPDAAEEILQQSMVVDADGNASSQAYTDVVKNFARWFLLPHEAAQALTAGLDLTLLQGQEAKDLQSRTDSTHCAG